MPGSGLDTGLMAVIPSGEIEEEIFLYYDQAFKTYISGQINSFYAIEDERRTKTVFGLFR